MRVVFAPKILLCAAAVTSVFGAFATSASGPGEITCSPWEGVDLEDPGPTTPFNVLQAVGAERCGLHSTSEPRVYGPVVWSMFHLFARWFPVRTTSAPRVTPGPMRTGLPYTVRILHHSSSSDFCPSQSAHNCSVVFKLKNKIQMNPTPEATYRCWTFLKSIPAMLPDGYSGANFETILYDRGEDDGMYADSGGLTWTLNLTEVRCTTETATVLAIVCHAAALLLHLITGVEGDARVVRLLPSIQ